MKTEHSCMCIVFWQYLTSHPYLFILFFLHGLFIGKFLRKIFYNKYGCPFELTFFFFFLLGTVLPPITWLIIGIKWCWDWNCGNEIFEATKSYDHEIENIKENKKIRKERRMYRRNKGKPVDIIKNPKSNLSLKHRILLKLIQ